MKKIILITTAILIIMSFRSNLHSQDKNYPDRTGELRRNVKADLVKNILPWWSAKMTDHVNGGFYGRIDVNDKVWPEADKGGILNARILWTYASAYRVIGDTAYLNKARQARDYIFKHFLDPVYGGAYRSVKYNGDTSDTRKQTYTLSFFIYGLAEFSRATGDRESLEKARDIYRCIEKYASDRENGGYFELFTRDWKRDRERLIGEKDERDEKTMNTHLHLLESYTSLYRIWPDAGLKKNLLSLISLFEKKIIDSTTNHLIPFLDRKWNPTSATFSFGHDIECSWLLCEAAAVLDDAKLRAAMNEICIKIADAASSGLMSDGSMATEKDLKTGRVTGERSWWEQAETVVGYLNAYELTGNVKYFGIATGCDEYIRKSFVDRKNGGWYSEVGPDGKPGSNDKAGFWVCPYHNGRMCLEVMERTGKTVKK